MKRFVFLMLVIMLIGGIAYSQSDKTKKQKNSPQEKVTVNKEYDENGNMIGFDSTYVYSWSGDSSITGFPNDADFSDFFNWKGNFFNNDSVSNGDPFHGFGFDDNEFENFFNQFSKMFPDSANQDLYSYRNDSILHFFGDSARSRAFHFDGENFPFDFQWDLNDSTMTHFFSEPQFIQGDSIWQKHQKLLEQHMQEMEEFQKKFFQF